MRKLTCYAWGKPGDWEALCVDLDIATQGASFEEVRDGLQLMVEDFLDYAAELPEPNRKFLLSRRAPRSVRTGLFLRHKWWVFTKTCQRLLFANRWPQNSAAENAVFVIGQAR